MKQALMRLYQEEAEFVIGDPTEMKRYKAPKTAYVGTLKDGKTAGYWLLVLSPPFRGRSLPFSFVVYSSKTIQEQGTSRNQEHFRCFREVKQLLGDQRKQPCLTDADGEPVQRLMRPGETVIHPKVYDLGRVRVKVIGYWRKGLSQPLWIMTSLDPKRALEIYQKRMKIEQTFRDSKDLLHLTKLMNKTQALLEQMIALALIAYVVGVWLGEAIRDVVYGQLDIAHVPDALLNKPPIDANQHPCL